MRPWAPCFWLCVAAGCTGRWPASMEDQPSLEPQEAPRAPPSGSIPVGCLEVIEDRDEAAGLGDPAGPADAAAAERGARLFAVHCTACHGDDGRGRGKVSEKLPPAPDLRYVAICRRTDGFLYATLTVGGQAMPPLREALSSRDRWDLVAFVRRLQAPGCVGGAAGIPHEGGQL